jgi:hypothetical protein
VSGRRSRLAVGVWALGAISGRAFAQQVEKQETAVAAPTYVSLGALAENTDVACNAGGCLAVWQDARTRLYTNWAMRFLPDGSPQDPAAFLLASPTSSELLAAVATDGDRFMVAWMDLQNLYTTRVDPDGSFSTAQVATGAFDPALAGSLAIAAGGDGYLVVAVQPLQDINVRIVAVRLDRDGRLLDTQPIELAASAAMQGRPGVVWTGAQYLVVWNNWLNPDHPLAVGARVRADGTVLDPGGFVVTTLGGYSHQPRFAWGGGVLMMVAGNGLGNAGESIESLTLDADGKNPQPFNLAPSGPTSIPYDPAVAWNGTHFVVTWIDGTGRLVAARVAPDRTVVDPTALVLSGPTAQPRTPRLGASAGMAQIIYVDFGDYNRLYTLSIGANGAINKSTSGLIDAASAQQLLAAGRGAGQTLLVWSDEANGWTGESLQAARIGDDGTVLDRPALNLGPLGMGAARAAGVGFAAGTYLVSWWDGVAIRAARVSTAGAFLDATSISVADVNLDRVKISVGYDGQGFVVSWSGLTGLDQVQSVLNARRVGLDGALAGSAFTIGLGNGHVTPDVLATGSNACIAAWAELDDPIGVRVASIGPGGIVGPSRTPVPSLTFSPAPALVPVGSRLLLWQGRTGAILDATDPFAVSGQTYSVSRDIGIPTWNGTMFVSAAPTSMSADMLPAGIDVNLMAVDGTLSAPTTLTDETMPVFNPIALGLGGGRSLVAYSRLIPESSFGNYQVRFQIVDTTATSSADGGVDADAGPVVAPGKSGCSCGLARGGPAAWSWIAVALALLRARRRPPLVVVPGTRRSSAGRRGGLRGPIGGPQGRRAHRWRCRRQPSSRS